MVIAHHIILTGYGHWLPNDPRGSLSTRIRVAPLVRLSEVHYGRAAIQPSREALRAFHQSANTLLKYDVLWFDSAKRQAIAESFAEIVAERRYTCFSCAILTNHAHLVIRRHRDPAEEMIAALWRVSMDRMRAEAQVPQDHPVWSQDPYKKFLDSPEAVRRAIQYVLDNPMNSGLPPQAYQFVKPYRGEWSGRR